MTITRRLVAFVAEKVNSSLKMNSLFQYLKKGANPLSSSIKQPPPTQATLANVVTVHHDVPEDVASRCNLIVSMDCEMVQVSCRQQAVASCSIVGYNGQVIYHSFIEPPKSQVDRPTKWSMNHAVPREQALNCIRSILKHKIIVGHGLYNDLKVLGISNHPRTLLRDTAKCPVVHRLTGYKQPSLRFLAAKLLHKKIQKGQHCSLEDAIAVMDVYKVVGDEWEKLLTEQQ